MAEGKIIKALSGFYYVLHEEGIAQCRGRGVFRKNKITPLVGDDVIFEPTNETEGYIMEIKKRKNELIRPPISNVDQAVIIFSATEPAFNPFLLDRFLVLIEHNNITPVICITKIDLLDEETKSEINRYVQDYEHIGYDVIFTSAKTKEGIDQLRPYLREKVSVFAGQSGVGKSSLLNALLPQLSLKTNEISNYLGRGKHTTRHVELIQFENGLVADTPGFSSLEFTDLEAEDLSNCFPEMKKRADYCKFRGCLHVSEPKCAVKEAVEKEEIPKYRYEHYVEFLTEIKERKPRY